MKSSVTRQQYLYVTLTVIMGAVVVALIKGWWLPGQRTMNLLIGGVCVFAGLGSIVRAYNASRRTNEQETAALRAGLRAQMGVAAAQQERNRLARDLHDSIKQQLFSIQMSTAAAQARWETDPEGARRAVADARAGAHEALAEMNALLQQLSPAPLEKVGLVQALRDQCEALGYRSGAAVAVAIGALPDDADFPPGAQEALFRIAQEALSNIARHARAQHVTLSLSQAQPGGPVALEIHDDGQGFDAATAPQGMGLNNIRQRVAALGGKLEIQSTPGAGTTLCARVELTPAPAIEGPLSPLLNKTILVGLVGGLALLAALFYPLYTFSPQGVIEGWPAGSPVLGVLCALIAVGVSVGVGYVAVRRSGGVSQSGALACGALAGSVAWLVVYLSMGMLAAGVPASRWMQEPYPAWMVWEMEYHGFYPDELPWEAAMNTSNIQTQRAFWIALLCGAGLGALGGWLAARRTQPSPMPDLSRQIFAWLAPASLFSALILLGAISSYGTTIQFMDMNQFIKPGSLALRYDSHVASISSLLLIYLATTGGLYVQLRANIRRGTHAALGSAQIAAVVFGTISLGIAGLALWRAGKILLAPTPTRILPGVLLAGCVALGGLYWLSLREIRPRWQALGLGALHVPRILALTFLPLSLIILTRGLGNVSLTVFVFTLAADVLGVITLWKRPKTPILGGAIRSTAWQGSDLISAVGLGFLLSVILPIVPYLTNLIAFLGITSLELADDPVGAMRLAFLAQAAGAVGVFVAGLAAVGLSTLALDGIMALAVGRR